jgi:hypothetical protein
MCISRRQKPASHRINYQVPGLQITFDAFLTVKNYPMTNEQILPENVPAAPVNECTETEVKKEAKIKRWLSFAGIVLQALVGIFSKKN